MVDGYPMVYGYPSDVCYRLVSFYVDCAHPSFIVTLSELTASSPTITFPDRTPATFRCFQAPASSSCLRNTLSSTCTSNASRASHTTGPRVTTLADWDRREAVAMDESRLHLV